MISEARLMHTIFVGYINEREPANFFGAAANERGSNEVEDCRKSFDNRIWPTLNGHLWRHHFSSNHCERFSGGELGVRCLIPMTVELVKR